jgi:deoxyribose-phosphate aldolase
MSIPDRIHFAKLIEHTLLRPDATGSDIKKICEEAIEHGFYSVCVHPFYVQRAGEFLSRTGVRLTTVISFPLGMTLRRVKIFEAKEAVMAGADELDIVMNIGEVKGGNWGSMREEISDIIAATPGVVHKIIIETHYLTKDEIIKASVVAKGEGAEYIKTSSGFASGGAVVSDIALIKTVTNGKIGIKAAGGIRTLKEARGFVEAGATRIGTSSGVNIMKELQYLEKTQKNC